MKKPSKKSIIIILVCAVICVIIPVIILSTKKTSKKNTEPQGKLILGFSQIGSESAWRTRNTQSIFEAAEQNDIQIIFDDAQQKQANQLKAIRSFIVYQVQRVAIKAMV